MYRIEFLIKEDLPATLQSETILEVGTVIEVEDESGLSIAGRIVSIRIRADRQPSLEDA